MRALPVISILAAYALVGCTAPAQTLAPLSSHFSGSGVAFAYPSNWNAAHFEIASSHVQAIVFLSTETLSDPCVRTANSGGCGSPVSALRQNGVLVDWAHRDFFGWTLEDADGSLTEIGGRRARVDWTAAVSENCARLGGGGELVATTEIPAAPDNWMEMRACVVGPAYDINRGQLEAMLASVTWDVP